MWVACSVGVGWSAQTRAGLSWEIKLAYTTPGDPVSVTRGIFWPRPFTGSPSCFLLIWYFLIPEVGGKPPLTSSKFGWPSHSKLIPLHSWVSISNTAQQNWVNRFGPFFLMVCQAKSEFFVGHFWLVLLILERTWELENMYLGKCRPWKNCRREIRSINKSCACFVFSVT